MRSLLCPVYLNAMLEIMIKFKLDVSDEILKALGDVAGKKEMTQKAREKNKEIIIYTKTLQELDGVIQQGSFDRGIMRDTLHHIRGADEIMGLCHKYLKVGGEIIIWEFNIKSFKTKFFWLFETLYFEKPHMFSPEGLC